MSRDAATIRYHDKVASLGCMIGRVMGESHAPANIHHIREGQGMAQRADDFLVIPLCHDCHQGPLGIHGDRTLLRITKMSELDLLAMTIREVTR